MTTLGYSVVGDACMYIDYRLPSLTRECGPDGIWSAQVSNYCVRDRFGLLSFRYWASLCFLITVPTAGRPGGKREAA